MARLLEGEPRPNPATTLDNVIVRRHQELLRLSDGFRRGLDLISDLGRVNELLAASPRPDLVMTEVVPMMPVETIEDLGKTSNFTPNMRSFGIPEFGENDSWSGRPKFVGRREYTDEEREKAFFMGARGDYYEHLAFAAENGIDKAFATDLLMQTHVNSEAFMRMWILMPELTEELITACLERQGGKGYEKVDEEIFVAYQLMSRLVDRNDRGAIRVNGSVDNWLLCH